MLNDDRQRDPGNTPIHDLVSLLTVEELKELRALISEVDHDPNKDGE